MAQQVLKIGFKHLASTRQVEINGISALKYVQKKPTVKSYLEGKKPTRFPGHNEIYYLLYLTRLAACKSVFK